MLSFGDVGAGVVQLDSIAMIATNPIPIENLAMLCPLSFVLLKRKLTRPDREKTKTYPERIVRQFC